MHETFMFVSTIRFALRKEQIRIALELRGAQAANIQKEKSPQP
ncbi:hypothetical protein [Sporosarcina sp. FSL K6-5500]